MASCLGLYLENNIIKYAKVSKSNDALKVESFGIKFYENLEECIKQIVDETYSYKDTICINTSDEMFNKIEVFSLLSKKDIENIIKTEFEDICYQKDLNEKTYEKRYVLSNNDSNSEKIKVTHIAVPKTSILQRKNYFNNLKISAMFPIGVSIANLVQTEKKENNIIVNIEKNTTISTVTNNVVSDVNVLNIGSEKIIENINQKENSYSKAYEICKNTTIYTENDKDLQYEENEYLEDIMPTLFEIVSKVRELVENSIEKIDNIYITGTAAVINNIDIYFQDYLKDIHCEILKPNFISNAVKINIKDYIEVNSAISIALEGLNKNTNINFLKGETTKNFQELLKQDVRFSKPSEILQQFEDIIQKHSSVYNSFTYTVCLLAVSYILGTCIINNKLNKKGTLTDESIEQTNQKISQVQSYDRNFNDQITLYQNLISNIENLNNNNLENKRFKNTIPNLLNNIMAVIPAGVQLISIENTSDAHIVIIAKTLDTEQMAYFKTKIKTEEILKNVVSDTGTWIRTTNKKGRIVEDYLKVTIEGELP